MKKYIAAILMLVFTGSMYSQGQMKVGAQLGIEIPMGNLGDLVGMGFGGHGLFIYTLQPGLDLTGSLGYYTFGEKKDLGAFANYSYSDVPLLAGVRYSFPTTSTFAPYVGAEIGLHFQSISFDYPDNEFFGGRSFSESSTDFGFSPLAGFRYPFNPDMTLDVTAKFNIVSDANSFGIYAGLLWGI